MKNFNKEKVYLDKSKFLALNDTKIEEVEIPEWESTVYVRALTAKELMDYVNATIDIQKGQSKDLAKSQLLMVAYCLCDSEGKRLIQDNEISLLENKNAGVINRIFEAAQRVSGLSATKN